MKIPAKSLLSILAVSLLAIGCGDDGGAVDDLAVPGAPAQGAGVTPAASVADAAVAPPVVAPPTGTAPATLEPVAAEPDLFANYKTSRDGSPNKTDVEALQAIVDGYAFGPDGLGAPPLKTLDDLVTSGYIKRLPPPPQGMKWAYDSPKWKVSVVPK